jgi:hypothetical protein
MSCSVVDNDLATRGRQWRFIEVEVAMDECMCRQFWLEFGLPVDIEG